MLESRYFFDIHPVESNHRRVWVDVLRYAMLFCAGGFAVLYGAATGWALPTIDQLLPSNEQLEMVVNKSALVRMNLPINRVSIVAPEIADVQVMDDKQVLLTALSAGETTLVVWQEDGSVRTIDVVVKVNTKQIREALQHTLPGEAIEVMPMNQGVALRGQVQGIGNVDQAMEIANSYSPQVVNLLDVPGVHQVLLKVRIAEVARTFRQEAGVNFQILDNSFQGTSMLGGLVSGSVNQPNMSVSDAVTMFMGLPNSNINAFVQALEEKGMLHVLAEPNLVARSGETASFLAGGEFPVPVVQGGAMSNSISIEYKEFGVRLRFKPTVLDAQNVQLDIAPEVSDLDFAQGVRISGFLIPVITTRRAQTVVNLRDGQSFAIAGLISRSKQKNRRKVPLVGDIPVLGGLFRGGDLTEKETELLIMVTPHLVAPINEGQPTLMPGGSMEGLEPNPFMPEETPSEIEPMIQSVPEIQRSKTIESEDIPTIYPQNQMIPAQPAPAQTAPTQSTPSQSDPSQSDPAGSKSRHLQDKKSDKPPITLSPDKLTYNPFDQNPSDSLACMPAYIPRAIFEQLVMSVVVSPKAIIPVTVKETNEHNVKEIPVTPMKRTHIDPVDLPIREKSMERKESVDKVKPSPIQPSETMITQGGMESGMKPGLVPIEEPKEMMSAIASTGMGKYPDGSSQKNMLKAVDLALPKEVILASLTEEN